MTLSDVLGQIDSDSWGNDDDFSSEDSDFEDGSGNNVTAYLRPSTSTQGQDQPQAADGGSDSGGDVDDMDIDMSQPSPVSSPPQSPQSADPD